MKLKKIVSLAMAGVLAVSMLAGCNNGTGSSSSSSEQKPADTLTDSVIAALSEATTEKVAFTYDAGLKADAEKLIGFVGTSTADFAAGITSANLVKVDSDLSADTLPALDTASKLVKNDDDEHTVAIATYVASSDASDDFNAKAVAKAMDNATVASTSTKMNALPTKGNSVASKTDGIPDCMYTFNYTGKVAVVAVDDVYGTTTGYVVVFTVTRTGTQHTNL